MGAPAPNLTFDSADSTPEPELLHVSQGSSALRLAVPSDLSAVRRVVASICLFLAEKGLSEAEVMACELAVVEACNNAILYAEDHALPVEIQVLCECQSVELQIVDHTPGFDWPKTVALPNPEHEHGRGLFIISSLMDEVHYLRSSRENRLIMRKHLAKPCETHHPENNARAAAAENTISAMSRDLCFRSDELAAIFRCASQFGDSADLEEFSRRLLEDLRYIAGADWFVLRLLSEDGTQLLSVANSDRSLKLQPILLSAKSQSRPIAPDGQTMNGSAKRNGSFADRLGTPIRSVERRAALSRTELSFNQQRPLSSTDPLAAQHPGSTGLIRPIVMSADLLGTLAVGRHVNQGPFTDNQLEAIRIFSDFLAIQVVNTRLRQAHIESRLLGHELDIARKIQQSLLPKSFPSLPGFGVSGFCLSARQVGGDFYDVFPISEDRALFVVADVMGKGVPAALFAATLRTLIRTTAEWTHRPTELLNRVNRLMFDELSGVDMFITACVALFEASHRRLVIANAGHCKVLVANKSGDVEAISPEGMPLGIMPDVRFEKHVVWLHDFRSALFYTDGLIDCRNAHGEFFGEERLREWFKRSASQSRPAAGISEDFLAHVSAFQGPISANDDQTFLVLSDESGITAQPQPKLSLPSVSVVSRAASAV